MEGFSPLGCRTMESCNDVPCAAQDRQEAGGRRWLRLRQGPGVVWRSICAGGAGFLLRCHSLLLGCFGVARGLRSQIFGLATASLVARILRQLLIPGSQAAVVIGNIVKISGHRSFRSPGFPD